MRPFARWVLASVLCAQFSFVFAACHAGRKHVPVSREPPSSIADSMSKARSRPARLSQLRLLGFFRWFTQGFVQQEVGDVGL
ncbi:MAG: hypothetical protein AAF471_09535 [Myxococcota bacterium]